MNVFERLYNIFSREAGKIKTPTFPPSQVDVSYDASPISEGTSYCRLHLAETRLAKDKEWFNSRYPVVYTVVTYHYNNEKIMIPSVVGVDYFKQMTDTGFDRVVTQNIPLTPLFPYARGLLEIKAGLFSMQASDALGSFINAMERFSKILPVPEPASLVEIVNPLYRSMEDLLEIGDSRLELGYQQTFSSNEGGGGHRLNAGYFAVIFAPEDKFRDEELQIRSDSLYRQEAPGQLPKALTGFSYMLFRIETRDQQDWESLNTIRELVRKAEDADEADSETLLKAIKVAIARSPDVVQKDRLPMFEKIKSHLEELNMHGPERKRSLFQIMQRQVTIDPSLTEEWKRLVNLFSN